MENNKIPLSLTDKEQNSERILELSDELQNLCDNSENKRPYTVNIFEYYNSYEPTTSWVLAQVFKYKYQGKFVIVKLFVERYLKYVGFDVSWVNKPTITAESNRIDVLIREKDYAIIIENKLKGAQYQRNQLARYINRLIQDYNYKPEQIFLVLLPKDCDNEIDYASHLYKSVWSLPPDDYCTNNINRKHLGTTRCWCDDKTKLLSEEEKTYCEKCRNLKRQYINRTVTIHKDLSNFGCECLKIIPQSEPILRSVVVQLIDFLNLQYKNRNNDKLNKEMEEFIRKQLLSKDISTPDKWKLLNQKLKEINELKATMKQVRRHISSEMIDEWYMQLSTEWKGGLKYEKSKCFYIYIKGVKCGCWYENNESNNNESNDEPYWGFWSNEPLSSEKKEMVNNILEKAGMGNMGESKDKWIRRYNTLNGALRCDAIYKAAIECNYLTSLVDSKI